MEEEFNLNNFLDSPKFSELFGENSNLRTDLERLANNKFTPLQLLGDALEEAKQYRKEKINSLIEGTGHDSDPPASGLKKEEKINLLIEELNKKYSDEMAKQKKEQEEKAAAKEESEKKLLIWGSTENDNSENGTKPKYIAIENQHGIINKEQHIVAAATPLTGVSAIGREHAILVLRDKIRFLLSGHFEKVVLKTVYLDYLPEENDDPAQEQMHWPELQIQSQHRARCLGSAAHPRTLWNTGKTALETMTPQMMKKIA